MTMDLQNLKIHKKDYKKDLDLDHKKDLGLDLDLDLGIEEISVSEMSVSHTHKEISHKVSGREGTTSAVEEKALKLLGSGISTDQVACALGVSPSRISQLLAQEYFSEKVSALRYENLSKHNDRDSHYDRLEDTLIGKLEKSLPLMMRPETILGAIKVINGAKRRGAAAPDMVNTNSPVVNLIMPNIIAQKFTTNLNNQVVQAGDQSLLTMPSNNLLRQMKDADLTNGTGTIELKPAEIDKDT